MHVIVALAVGLFVGGGATWAFRGYIERKKNAVAKSIQGQLSSAAKKL